jgi:uncharacterized membrane protein
MDAYLIDWANLLLRWLHLIVGIAWIGASFYFVWLDNSLKPPEDQSLKDKGVMGELWAVHGGGFYNPQKYLGVPKALPDHLHWFYWESYSSWMSGFALFVVLYLFNPSVYLIDKRVLDLSPAMAIVAALGFLLAGWVVYNTICRLFGERGEKADLVVGILVSLWVVFSAWAACHLFSGRAAFLLTGAMIATIMSANVLIWIIPGQKKVIASMKAGQAPDPIHGKRAKQRSVHNTYFTLPVLLSMLSNHYSMLYQAKHNWVVLVVLMLAGVLIRQFFIARHKGNIQWGWWAAGIALIVGVIVALAPDRASVQNGAVQAKPVSFAQVKAIIEQRCVACHNAQVISKNVQLHTDELIRSQAQAIYQQAVVLKIMPMANSTGITEQERATLGAWFKAGATGL